jgi:hypothetical protein
MCRRDGIEAEGSAIGAGGIGAASAGAGAAAGAATPASQPQPQASQPQGAASQQLVLQQLFLHLWHENRPSSKLQRFLQQLFLQQEGAASQQAGAEAQPQAGSQQAGAEAQPQAGSQLLQPLSQPQAGASQQLFLHLWQENKPSSRPQRFLQQLFLQQEGAASQQAGAEAQPQAGSQLLQAGAEAHPQAGSQLLQPHAGLAAQPQAGSAAHPQAGSASQHELQLLQPPPIPSISSSSPKP